MTLSNKRTQYQIAESGQNVNIKGEVNILDEQNSFSISGSFTDAQDQILGSFAYVQQSDGKIDKSVNSIAGTLLQAAETLFNSVIVNVKTELNLA